MKKTRRELIKSTLTLSSVGALVAGTPISRALGLTPPQTEGPFYPLQLDNDLIRLRRGAPKAKGQVIHIQGRVLDEQGRGIPSALVEIWQASANGRYNHPGDPSTQPIDKNFQYFGRDLSDNAGTYRFTTIVPGHYPASNTWTRPAHIHFKVIRRGFHELTTQMYFKAQTAFEQDLLDRDNILQALSASDQNKVIVDFKDVPNKGPFEPNAKLGFFDLELRKVIR